MEPFMFKDKMKEPMSNMDVVVASIVIIELLFKAVDKRANWGYNRSGNDKWAS